MNESWSIKKLNEVCEVCPSKRQVKEKLDENDLVTYVPMGDLGIDQKYFTGNEERTMSDAYKGYTYFEEGDVVLAKITPCFENGKLGIAKDLINGVGFGSTEFIPYRTGEQLLSGYLYYFLNQPSFRKRGERLMTGAAGHQRIPKDFYEEHEIPIPPLDEQRRIISILDNAFEAIEHAKNNIEQNIENAKELFESKLDLIFSQPNKNWEEKKIKNISKTASNIKWEETEGERDYIDLTSVSRESLKITETEKVNSDNAPSRAKKIVKDGDVIFGTTRPTLKRVTIIDKEFSNQICSTGYYVIRPNREVITSEWIFLFLQTKQFMDRMKRIQSGASYPAVNYSDMKNSVIRFPKKLDDQKRITSLLFKLQREKMSLIHSLEQKLSMLEELKKSILKKAFSGKLTKNNKLVA